MVAKQLLSVYDSMKLMYPVMAVALITWACKNNNISVKRRVVGASASFTVLNTGAHVLLHKFLRLHTRLQLAHYWIECLVSNLRRTLDINNPSAWWMFMVLIWIGLWFTYDYRVMENPVFSGRYEKYFEKKFEKHLQ